LVVAVMGGAFLITFACTLAFVYQNLVI
jgi:hypothetical protein